MDRYFLDAWKLVERLDRRSYREHQLFYQERLLTLFESNVEINSHIYRKPLGYAGDFITMNYIFNYHSGNYLGKTSYEMLINNYTCTIPFAYSNIKRKDVFKKRILETSSKKENGKILSVGSGPLRELLELLQENRINKPLAFTCIDFEKKALEYVENEIEKIDLQSKRFLSVTLLYHDIFSLIDNKIFIEGLRKTDLIYASGLFDYLLTQSATNLLSLLFSLLNNSGLLIVSNANVENNSHRAYFEMLGEWNMLYRTGEEMLNWSKGLEGEAIVSLESLQDCPSYMFLKLEKHGSI